MTKRKLITIISLSIVAMAGGYLAFVKIRNKKEIKKIHLELDGSGGYGTIKDLADVFSGGAYINNIKVKNPNIILLQNAAITEYRKKLYDAISGSGTDEESVFSVFRDLKDKIQIAQIADSYQRNYNVNLLDALLDESSFSEKSDNTKELLNIIKAKLDYRVAM